MAKTTAKTEKKPETKAKETPPETAKVALPEEVVPISTPVAEEKAAKKPKKRYVFPRQNDIQCPGCGLYETVATSTQGQIQSRRCTRAVPRCEKTFQVTGKEVKFTDCK